MTPAQHHSPPAGPAAKLCEQMEGEVAAGGFRWEFRRHFDRGELVVEPSLGRLDPGRLRFLVKSDYALEAGGDHCFTVRAAFKPRRGGFRQHQGRQIIHRPWHTQARGSSRCQSRAGETGCGAHAPLRCRLRLQHHSTDGSAQPRPCAMARQRCHRAQHPVVELVAANAAPIRPPGRTNQQINQPLPLESVRTLPHFWRPGSSAAQPQLMDGAKPLARTVTAMDPGCRHRARPPPPNAQAGCLGAPS